MGRPLDPKIQTYAKADGTVTYRVRVRANGRQTTETFHSLAGAETFVRRCKDPAVGVERAIELRDREDTASPGYVPTIREALHKHCGSLSGVDERTPKDYLRIAERSWLNRLGSLRVDEFTRDDDVRWVKSATGKKAPKTIRNEHSVLSATLQWAVDQGHISGNPCRGVRLPRAGEEDVEDIHFLTHAEFNILYTEIPEAHRPIVVHMFGMGMRWSETSAQQKRDMDLAAGQHVGDSWESAPIAKVVRAWKSDPRRVGPPKSKAGRRAVVMPPEVVGVVEPMLDGLKANDWLFRTRTGGALTHSNFFNRIWKPATLRASICLAHRDDRCRCLTPKPYLCPIHTARDDEGVRILPEPCGCAGTIPFRPRIHDARHTHASWLIANGVRLEVVQERLGHEDYLTTRRLYAHLMPDAQLNAMAAASLAFARTALSAPPPRELG